MLVVGRGDVGGWVGTRRKGLLRADVLGSGEVGGRGHVGGGVARGRGLVAAGEGREGEKEGGAERDLPSGAAVNKCGRT